MRWMIKDHTLKQTIFLIFVFVVSWQEPERTFPPE